MSKEEIRRRQAKAAARKARSLRIAVIAAGALTIAGWVWALASVNA